jgi:hypothetical protein
MQRVSDVLYCYILEKSNLQGLLHPGSTLRCCRLCIKGPAAALVCGFQLLVGSLALQEKAAAAAAAELLRPEHSWDGYAVVSRLPQTAEGNSTGPVAR